MKYHILAFKHQAPSQRPGCTAIAPLRATVPMRQLIMWDPLHAVGLFGLKV